MGWLEELKKQAENKARGVVDFGSRVYDTVNVNDNGLSWNTRKISEEKRQQMALRDRYAQQNKAPQQSFGNKIRDVLDTNTQADQWRRQQQNYVDSKLYGGTGQQEVKITNAPNLFDNTLGAAPRVLNTAGRYVGTIPIQVGMQFATAENNTARKNLEEAVASGNRLAIQQARDRLTKAGDRLQSYMWQAEGINNQMKRYDGGLFGTGTMISGDQLREGNLKNIAQTGLADTAQAGLDVASLGLGGVTGKALVAGGTKNIGTNLVKQAPRLTANAGLNYGTGVSSAYADAGYNQQDLAFSDANKAGLISAGIGTVADTIPGLVYQGGRNAGSKLINTKPGSKVVDNVLSKTNINYTELLRTRKNVQRAFDVETNPTRRKQINRYLTALDQEIAKNRGVIPRSQAFIAGENAADFQEALKLGRTFEGVDGKPRFEVSDEGAKIKNPNGKTLGEVLDHPELYKQYPELKDAWFNVDESMGKNASYDPAAGRITVGKDADISTILHEAQHGIQGIEGFARGGDPGQLGDAAKAKLIDREFEKYKESNPNASKIDFILNNRDLLNRKYYKNLAGEAEARAVANRMNMTDGERYKDLKRYDFNTGDRTVYGIKSYPVIAENPKAAEVKAKKWANKNNINFESLNKDGSPTTLKKSTFYDSLDVPKEDLIIRDGTGKAMSVDPLESLKQEALKYKSAEEFVEASRNITDFDQEAARQIFKNVQPGDGEPGVIRALTDFYNQATAPQVAKTEPKAMSVEPNQKLNSQEVQPNQAQPKTLSEGQRQSVGSGSATVDTIGKQQARQKVAQLTEKTTQIERQSPAYKNIIQESVKLIEPPKIDETKLLGQGTLQLTPGQARQRFKALNNKGAQFEVLNRLNDGKQPFTVSPGGTARQGSNTIKVRQLGGSKNINVKRNAPNLADINPETLRDISGYDSRMKDIWRNTEKVFGNQYQDVQNKVLRPLDEAKGRYIAMQEELAGDLKTNVVDKYNIKKGSGESADIQLFGEGKLSREELVKRYGEKRANDLVEADKYFRAKYDQLLDQVNEARAIAYNGNPDKKIPKRKDYYRHFQEMQQGFEGLLNIFENTSGIAPELQGISQGTRPKSKWLSLAQQRKGDQTVYDAVGGYINYLQSATYATHIDPEIARIRNFSNSLRELNAASKNPVDIENYLTFLDDYANDLAGKTNDIDRVAMKFTGRKAFAVVDWVNKRAKANAILGNFASSIAQFYNIPIGLADAGMTNAPAGFKGFVKELTGARTPANKSIFLKERFSKPLSQFDVKLMDKAQNGAANLVSVGDEVGTRIIWHAQFAEAKGRGFTDANAIRFADQRTRATVAGRGVGEVPIAQKAKTFQLVAPFQLEVANQWHVFGDWKRQGAGKMAKGLVGYSIGAAIMNQMAEQIRGSGVIFDPIAALVDAWGEMTEEDVADTEKNESSDNIYRAGGRLAGEVIGNIPGGSYAAQMMFRDPYSRKQFFGDEDPSRFGTSPLAVTNTVGAGIDIARDPDNLYGYLKGATGIGTPFGGKQIERTTKAITDQIRGYATDRKGNPTYPAPTSPIRRGQALMFGTNSTDEARNYYNNDQRGVTGKDDLARLNLSNNKQDTLRTIQQEKLDRRDPDYTDKIRITNKTEKNDKGDYVSRDKYDALIHAMEETDGIKKNNPKYDTAELTKAIIDIKSEAEKSFSDAGLPTDMFNINGEFATKYAKYVKSVEGANQIDKDKKTQSFIKSAYKDTLDDTTRSFYSLGDDDMRTELQNGTITKEQMDKVIAIDNLLTSEGLQPYMQVGKTLRRELGYGLVESGSGGSKYASRKRSSGRSGGGRKKSLPKLDMTAYTNQSRVPTVQNRYSGSARPTGARYQPVQLRRYSASSSRIPTPPKITVRRGVA